MKVTDKFHFLLSWWQKIGCVIHERIDLGLIVTNLAQPLNYINARKNVFGFDQKNFVHILYIFTAIISSFFVLMYLRFIGPIVWFDVQEKGVKNIQNRRKIYGFSMQHIMYEEKTHKCLPPLLSKDMSWANVFSYITLFWNTVLDDSWNMIYLYFYGCYQTHLHAFKPSQF